ncbi:MAG TPA: AarF/UbiB family protein [Ktedonobacterales bacterium]
MASRVSAWTRRNRLWRTYRVGLLLLRTLYIINRERGRVMRAHARGETGVRPNIDALVRILREFRETATALGGLLIKLGQFLGARADLLPAEALAELASLHDAVPPEPFAAIKAELEREWHTPLGEVVSFLDPNPAGAASLGQVHEARLRDGRHVAIKVQRPDISVIVRTDLRTLRFVLRIVAWLAPAANEVVNLQGLYREFSRTVYEELDYEGEGRNAERFARIFTEDAGIVVPAIVWEHTTHQVLTMEWMNGIKITNFAALTAAHVDRDALARRLAESYFKQVLEAGFFHADPHPGNIFVQPDPGGYDRIVFLDFGMMGIVTPQLRHGLADCMGGAVARDAARIVRGLDELGFLGESADRTLIERAVDTMLSQFSGLPASRLREVDPSDIMQEIGPALYEQPFRLPAKLAFFGRAVGILFGVLVGLSPTFNAIEVATPYARQFMGRGGIEGILRLLGVDSLEGLGRDLVRESISLVRSITSLPRRLENVLDHVERGDLHVVIESATLSPRFSVLRRRGQRPGLLWRQVPLWVPVGAAGMLGATWLLGRVFRLGATRRR